MWLDQLDDFSKSETLREKIVNNLRDLICSGALDPGSMINEVHVAKKLGISRGPLREALQKLSEEGLVEIVPYKGSFVRKITKRLIEEIHSMRTNLECFAFKLIWDNRNDDFFTEIDERHNKLIKAINAGDGLFTIKAELNFHDFVYEYSNHSLLMKSWWSIRGLFGFYWGYHHRSHNRKGPTIDAHENYLNLAKGNDFDALIFEIENHVKKGLERTLETLNRSADKISVSQ